MTQTDPPRPARETLPTMYDLPSEEIGDAGLPDKYHIPKPSFSIRPFVRLWSRRMKSFVIAHRFRAKQIGDLLSLRTNERRSL